MLDISAQTTEAVSFEPAQLTPYKTFPTVIDNSMRKAFVSCPQRWYRQYVQGWTPRTPSVHLHAGGAFAYGLETARREFYEHNKPANDAILAGYNALLERYGDYTTASAKDAIRTAGALLYYFEQFPLEQDFIKPLIADGKAAIEFYFVHPLPLTHPDTGEPLLYSGRFDMLGVKNDVLYVVDEKTTSQLGSTWAAKWNHSAQFTGYCWGAQRFGFPVVGAIVRGISILKNGYGHAQSIQPRPQWVIDRWYSQLLRDVKRMVDCYVSRTYDFALDDACSAYGGCVFSDVCGSNDPQTWLEADFTVRAYDPTKRQ